MTTRSYSFLHLLSDLSRHAEVRDQLLQNPPAVLDRYAISPDALKVLRRGDAEQIVGQLTHEARALLGHLSAQPNLMAMPWAGPPDIFVASCTPSCGPVGVAVDVSVGGHGFELGAALVFSRPGVEVTATNVQVSEKGTVIEGKILLPTSGRYDVMVVNHAGPPFPPRPPQPLLAGFTAE